MDQDDLRFLPEQQILNASAIAAWGLTIGALPLGLPIWLPLVLGMLAVVALAALIRPRRRRTIRLAALATGFGTLSWFAFGIVGFAVTGALEIAGIGMAGAAASAWAGDRLWTAANELAASASVRR